MLRKRKGQAVLEYILILSAIIVGIILAKGAVRDRVQAIIEKPIGASQAVTDKISFLK